MFARFRTVLRAASYEFGGSRRIPRTNASTSSGGNTRQFATSAALLAVGAVGTVSLYKLTTSSKRFDGYSLSSYFSELLQQISPSFGLSHVSAKENPTCAETKNLSLKELQARAESILDYCMEASVDKVKKDKIIEELTKYLDQKKKGSGGTTETEKHLINDAIHGPIELSPLLYQIINTPEFHRLKDLRQLGATHYVYPGANHTRFEHSIGVAYVARRFAQSLQQQLNKDRERAPEDDKTMYEFDDKEVLCAEIAGLCHDLGHGPFSHMFEKVMKEKLKIEVHHEQLSVLIFKRMLAKNSKLLAEFVSEGLTEDHVSLIGNMINPPSIEERNKRLFLYEIVANKNTGIDVDKWDYYQRDCHYLGILQDFQWRRTMLLGRIVVIPDGYKGKNQLRIGFRDKEMENLYGMFRTRANIHRKACQHKTIKAVERMFIEAMDHIQDLQVIWVPSASDTESKGTFKSVKQAVDLAKKAVEGNNPDKLSWYLAMTDSLVGNIMSADACTESEQEKLDKAKKLLTRVEERDLYTCSAKKRVPRYFHPMEFLPEAHPSRVHCQSCIKALKEDKDLEIIASLYDEPEKCLKFGELVHDELLNEEKSVIKKENIWVEVVKIKHPSEKANNPVDEVLFYKKAKTPNDLPKTLSKNDALGKASMICVPQAFMEYELRVYDKRSRAERNETHQKALDKAMEKAWKAWPQKDYMHKQQ